MPSEAGDSGRWTPERRRQAGKAAFNRGLVAVAIAWGGYLIGFLIPALSSSGTRSGWAFFPVGGIAALLVAVSAIAIGSRVRGFARRLSEDQRARIASVWDLDRQVRFATLGIALGILSIVCNPLVGFIVVVIVR